MIADLLITNALIETPAGTQPGTITIAGGMIESIGSAGPIPMARQTIDARGLTLMPGVVDVHVHFREPGQEYKATYRSESAAAAAGGVTTICDMPNNGDRAIVNRDRLLAKIAVAANSSNVDFGVYAYLCAKEERLLRELVDAGVMGFKWDMSLAGTEVAPDTRLPLPEDALPYFQAAAEVGAVIGIHAEHRPLVLDRTAAVLASGRADAAAHLAARPVEAEVIALTQAIELCRRSRVRMHVHHLSTGAGLDLIRRAKDDGLPISVETIPPFLCFDERDYERLGTLLKIHPSVKYQDDRRALWAGLLDGSIDCIATDHAPHTREEKLRPVWDASPGAIGVQTSLPIMLDAVSRGAIGMGRVVTLMCSAPAALYGLDRHKGTLAPGMDADLVMVDLSTSLPIRNEDMYSLNHLTPYDGMVMQGKPVLTLLRGEVIADHGVARNAGSGRQVRPARLDGDYEAATRGAGSTV